MNVWSGEWIDRHVGKGGWDLWVSMVGHVVDETWVRVDG